MSIITLTSDFGTNDVYVGLVKGVIYSINPDVTIVDITHNIPSYDIISCALVISDLHKYFPAGTIHMVVVDPGVGTERNILMVEGNKQIFVGPDNGIFGMLVKNMQEKQLDTEFYLINAPKYYRRDYGNTFDARDKMAPVVAHLSLGLSHDVFAQEIKSIKEISIPFPTVCEDILQGNIIYVDNFGNLITNIHNKDVEKGLARCGVSWHDVTIKIGNIITNIHVIYGLSESYGNRGKGEPCAVIGGLGYLEVSINMGNASQRLGVKKGDSIFIVFRRGDET